MITTKQGLKELLKERGYGGKWKGNTYSWDEYRTALISPDKLDEYLNRAIKRIKSIAQRGRMLNDNECISVFLYKIMEEEHPEAINYSQELDYEFVFNRFWKADLDEKLDFNVEL